MSRYWREQGSEVCALDLSAQMLAEAQRHDVAHHYLLADIEAIPQAAATFDGTEQSGRAVVQRPTRCVKRAIPGGASRRNGGV